MRAADELTVPVRKWSLFENLERATDRIKLDPATMRAEDLASVARHLKAVREAAGKLNISHVLLVQLSVHVVGFIKAEVILAYLGLGVAVDEVSWGTMLQEAQSELIQGYWWQLTAATVFMAVFVTAFSLFTDALRDALDPKLRGLE